MVKGESEEIKESLKPVKMKLEQLEAQLTVLSGLRETYDARFTMLSEKIGEIRSMSMTQAKDSAETRAKAERAIMALEGIKPEEFRTAIMRRDAEVEALKVKHSSTEEMIKTLMGELKEFRNALTRFKGMEAVIGMADDARKNIIRIQQLRDQVEMMSDKVMTAFIDFQRRFKEVSDLSLKVSALEEIGRSTSRAVGEIDVQLKQTVPRAEFEKLTGGTQGSSKSGGKSSGFVDEEYHKELEKVKERLRDTEKIVSRILSLILSAK